MPPHPLNPPSGPPRLLTVIQDVDSSSLEANYQSFASLMEQRLAELFLVASRQGSQTARSRRATTVGGYTVQVGGNGTGVFTSITVLKAKLTYHYHYSYTTQE